MQPSSESDSDSESHDESVRERFPHGKSLKRNMTGPGNSCTKKFRGAAIYNKDEVLENAHFLNFQTRETSSQVEFFVTRYNNEMYLQLHYMKNNIISLRYPSLLPFSTVTELNKLEEEFLEYQLLERSQIPESVWESALVVEGESQYYRASELLAYMNTMKCGDGMLKFPRLSEVAKLALDLPHSNAEEERVFSMVTKNKTNFRPSLRLDGTLCSIITVKMDYEPPPTVLETAKKATVPTTKHIVGKHNDII